MCIDDYWGILWLKIDLRRIQWDFLVPSLPRQKNTLQSRSPNNTLNTSAFVMTISKWLQTWWRQWDHGQIWLTSGWIMELIENIHIWNDPKISYWGSLPPPSIFGFPMLSEIHPHIPHLQGLLDGFHLAIYMQKVVVHPGEFRFQKKSSTYTIPNKHDGILRQISPFKRWQVTSCDGFFAPIFFFGSTP